MNESIFDTIINRRGTYSRKWDEAEETFRHNSRECLMPFWIADMDFRTADEITDALVKECQFGVFGYPDKRNRCRQALKQWLLKHHDWDIDKYHLSFFPRIMEGIAIAIETFTKPGDKIVIQPPIYPPFMKMINTAGRVIDKNPLIKTDDTYLMDFEGLEALFKNGARYMMLCSPHNPTGRVWTFEELKNLASLCTKYNVTVFCDEIHHDLVYAGSSHHVFASITEDITDNVITFVAPTKTFNLAGLMASSAIIPNKEKADRFNATLERHDIQINQLGQTAFYTAYEQGENWLKQLLIYLEKNRTYIMNAFKNCSNISVFKPDGTYLYWLDFSKTGLSHDNIQERLYNVAHVALYDGRLFGAEGEKFERFNAACPRSYLTKGIKNIIDAFE